MDNMTPFPWFDVAIIILLVLINGIFAMSELAIVSARKANLHSLADQGNRGAKTALRLASDPGKFLSTVQIGITLIGIVAGAFSGASLGGPTAERLQLLGMGADLSGTVGFVLVIGLTTYASLVIGELVPKQIALRSAERIAIIMAPPMALLARVSAPLVWLLDNSSALIFRMLGMKRDETSHVTADELQMVFAEATRSGVIEEHERAVMAGVVRMADRPIREVMTPRTEVDWLDIDATTGEIHRVLIGSPHSRFPVAEDSVDDICGVVQARDIVAAQLGGERLDLRKLMRPLEKVPDQLDALDALDILREAEVPMVLVHDEYGHFEGIVTPNDLLSSIAGEFVSDRDERTQRSLIERADGSYLVSGAMAIDALAERLGIRLSEDRDYATVAGHALSQLRHLPEEGETFEDQDWIFEIVDMDGRKIDKLIVRAGNPDID
ncbi:hemolysin family protein [Parasphingorhabdus flavimaris]|uniref:HlyC/CorC family transporter n=1 Tax=Parasphingorhabdus flavimaris TaxID=266812 RepID=A0ABX2MYL8_9SPHN|nr:hemolysin family protein [Parasphingorhabdus flavimaris]NVD26501.1 HlyC/CorC family transporter [Parasphingorhabdus flavimaris]